MSLQDKWYQVRSKLDAPLSKDELASIGETAMWLSVNTPKEVYTAILATESDDAVEWLDMIACLSGDYIGGNSFCIDCLSEDISTTKDKHYCDNCGSDNIENA